MPRAPPPPKSRDPRAEAQEIERMISLGVCRFGNEVVVVVDLPH